MMTMMMTMTMSKKPIPLNKEAWMAIFHFQLMKWPLDISKTVLMYVDVIVVVVVAVVVVVVVVVGVVMTTRQLHNSRSQNQFSSNRPAITSLNFPLQDWSLYSDDDREKKNGKNQNKENLQNGRKNSEEIPRTIFRAVFECVTVIRHSIISANASCASARLCSCVWSLWRPNNNLQNIIIK